MLLFGHAGLTMAAVKVCEAVAAKTSPGFKEGSLSWLKADYRFVVIGSVLPDLIDKPPWVLGTGGFPAGHAYGHALLLSLALLAGGAVLMRFHKSWLFWLAVASLMHLAFDQIWRDLTVFLYPLFGQVPSLDPSGWVPHLFEELFSKPQTYIPEAAGFLILLVLGLRVIARRGVTRFFSAGTIG